MEEDWWGSEESKEPVLVGPQSVMLNEPGKKGNILSGEVEKVLEIKESGVWDQIQGNDSFKLPSWGWFLIGMILVPIILSIISVLLISIGEGGILDEEYYSDNAYKIDNVTIDEMEFEVYEFSMRSSFSDIFAAEGQWDLNIEGENNDEEFWRIYIYGNRNGPYNEEILDSENVVWYVPSSDIGPEAANIYVKVSEDNVYVATQDGNYPTHTAYWGNMNDSNNGSFFWASCFIWPITIVGGSAWAFVTNRKTLAYGIWTWGIFILFGLSIFGFLWFIGF